MNIPRFSLASSLLALLLAGTASPLAAQTSDDGKGTLPGMPVNAAGEMVYAPFTPSTDVRSVRLVSRIHLKGRVEDISADKLTVLVNESEKAHCLVVQPVFAGAKLGARVIQLPPRTVVTHAAFSPDGTKIIYNGNTGVVIFDLVADKETQVPVTDERFQLAMLKWITPVVVAAYEINRSPVPATFEPTGFSAVRSLNLETLQVAFPEFNGLEMKMIAGLYMDRPVKFSRVAPGGAHTPPGGAQVYLCDPQTGFSRSFPAPGFVDMMGWPDGSVMLDDSRTTLYFFAANAPSRGFFSATTDASHHLSDQAVELIGQSLKLKPYEAPKVATRDPRDFTTATIYRPMTNPVTGGTVADTSRPVAYCRIISKVSDGVYRIATITEFHFVRKGDVVSYIQSSNLPAPDNRPAKEFDAGNSLVIQSDLDAPQG